MPHPALPAAGLSSAERRRSCVAAYANASLWGLGNGLANTTLVTYLAREYHASGLAVSWLLAAPSMGGLLRLFTPAWLDRVASRRRLCIGTFLASAAALAALPILSAPGVLPSAQSSLVALAAMWATYQVLEFIAVVVMWSWYGDLVPMRVRGRFVGRREAWKNAGTVVGTVASAVGTQWWHNYCQQTGAATLEWRAYAVCGLVGALLFAAATFPLVAIVDLPQGGFGTTRQRFGWRDLVTPLADARFRRLMAFGLWFSFANGVTYSAQTIYVNSVLAFTYAWKKTLDATSRGIQACLLPWAGVAVDRRGNVPVLAASQAIVSLATLFFLYATPDAKWWALGAYVCWLAYAGENVALPNLMLGLSEPGRTSAYAAAWFAWTELAFSLSILAGGAALDWLGAHFHPITTSGRSIDRYVVIFAASWMLKSLGVLLARRIPEPQK